MAQKKKQPEEPKVSPEINPDPITGEKGSHPLGTGIGAAAGGLGGAAAGAAAGAAIGSAATGPAAPIGGVVGAAAGAIAGAYAGKNLAEQLNPTEEDEYWRHNFRDRPYVSAEGSYQDYGPAYQYGWESRGRYPGLKFEDAEEELKRDWSLHKGQSTLNWSEAREACCDAWERCDQQQQAQQERHTKIQPPPM